jgi:hypothetical protein
MRFKIITPPLLGWRSPWGRNIDCNYKLARTIGARTARKGYRLVLATTPGCAAPITSSLFQNMPEFEKRLLLSFPCAKKLCIPWQACSSPGRPIST